MPCAHWGVPSPGARWGVPSTGAGGGQAWSGAFRPTLCWRFLATKAKNFPRGTDRGVLRATRGVLRANRGVQPAGVTRGGVTGSCGAVLLRKKRLLECGLAVQ